MKEFLTIQDLMEFSGECESTWRKRLSRREITYVKFGENVRIPQSAFCEWCRERTIDAFSKVKIFTGE